VYSSSVTDAEWAILEPLLPAPGSTAGRGGRPEKHCRRAIVDAILYIVRGGIAWRQLPVEFPPAGTVYAVFARWARSGAWQRILDALRDRLRVRAGRDRCPTAAIIDSQTVPAADTVPRSSRGWDGGKRTNGVKRHIAVDASDKEIARDVQKGPPSGYTPLFPPAEVLDNAENVNRRTCYFLFVICYFISSLTRANLYD